MKHIIISLSRTILLGTCLLLCTAPILLAQNVEFSELVQQLTDRDTNTKIKVIERLSASGHERTENILRAMLEGSLFEAEDRMVIATDMSGEFFAVEDAVTGEDLGEIDEYDLEKVRVNNRLRSVLDSALGSMNLNNSDESKREKAIDAVMNNRDASLLPVLKNALETETNPSLIKKLKITTAAIQLEIAEDAESIQTALHILASKPSPEIRSLLLSYINEREEEEENENLAYAKETLKDIESSLRFWDNIGNIYRGVSLGSVLLLAAVGLAITFGVMRVINMAHGEMVMLGAYSTFVVQGFFRDYLPNGLEYSIFVALPVAFMVSCIVGIIVERCIIQFLYGRPLETLLATWGLSLILQQSVRSIFGPTNREVSSPSWMSGAYVFDNGLVITYNRFWIIVFSILVVAGVALVMRKTQFGLRMRAVTQNRPMARSMGIRTGRIDSLTFGMGSGIAGIAGVALSQIDNVSPNLGQSYIIDSFMVVVFGGVGNIMGTVVGAMTLGITNKFLEPMAGAVMAKILVLVAIILFIQKKPSGLFALKGRSVES